MTAIDDTDGQPVTDDERLGDVRGHIEMALAQTITGSAAFVLGGIGFIVALSTAGDPESRSIYAASLASTLAGSALLVAYVILRVVRAGYRERRHQHCDVMAAERTNCNHYRKVMVAVAEARKRRDEQHAELMDGFKASAGRYAELMARADDEREAREMLTARVEAMATLLAKQSDIIGDALMIRRHESEPDDRL